MMVYPESWKALKVLCRDGTVYVYERRQIVGYINGQIIFGAKSAGGMITNKVWQARRVGSDNAWKEFRNKHHAMRYILEPLLKGKSA